MNRQKNHIALLATISILAIGGCASNLGGETYAREEARHAMRVSFGYIESIRLVSLEGTRSGIGPMAGAVLGGVIGSSLGRGSRSSAAGTILGAIAGGVGGAAIEENATRQRGLEITVRLDNGEYLAVVQTDQGEDFQAGDRIRLIRDHHTARITR